MKVKIVFRLLETHLTVILSKQSRSQWMRGLRRRSTDARLLHPATSNGDPVCREPHVWEVWGHRQCRTQTVTVRSWPDTVEVDEGRNLRNTAQQSQCDIPDAWTWYPMYAIWPPQRRASVSWLIAHFVSYMQRRQQAQSMNDCRRHLREARGKLL
jgi:hypothetical protein